MGLCCMSQDTTLIFLVALNFCRYVHTFSGCGWSGLLFCYSVASCGGGLSCRAQAIGTQASVVAAQGFTSCGSWALELAGFRRCTWAL